MKNKKRRSRESGKSHNKTKDTREEDIKEARNTNKKKSRDIYQNNRTIYYQRIDNN